METEKEWWERVQREVDEEIRRWPNGELDNWQCWGGPRFKPLRIRAELLGEKIAERRAAQAGDRS